MKWFTKMFFLCLYCNGMRADIERFPESINFVLANEGYFSSIPKNCSILLDGFADYAANFTWCSIKNARPIRICKECVEQFINFRNVYQELLTTVVNGTSCKSIFVSHDRLDAVLEYHKSISAIWYKGHCDACFTWSQGKPELSNDTKLFNEKFVETKACFEKNMNDASNNSAVCEKCMLPYVHLDELYRSLSEDSIGVDSVCMDIVDSMNETRFIWSKELHCCSLRESPEIIFLCCTGIIGALPILFYLAVKYCGPIRDLPNVLKQSRFKQIILRSNGRIN